MSWRIKLKGGLMQTQGLIGQLYQHTDSLRTIYCRPTCCWLLSTAWLRCPRCEFCLRNLPATVTTGVHLSLPGQSTSTIKIMWVQMLALYVRTSCVQLNSIIHHLKPTSICSKVSPEINFRLQLFRKCLFYKDLYRPVFIIIFVYKVKLFSPFPL